MLIMETVCFIHNHYSNHVGVNLKVKKMHAGNNIIINSYENDNGY